MSLLWFIITCIKHITNFYWLLCRFINVKATVHCTSNTFSLSFAWFSLCFNSYSHMPGVALTDKVGQCSWGQEKDSRGGVSCWRISVYCSDIGRSPSVQLLLSSVVAIPFYHSEKWLQLIHLWLKLLSKGCVCVWWCWQCPAWCSCKGFCGETDQRVFGFGLASVLCMAPFETISPSEAWFCACVLAESRSKWALSSPW